jgi:hypothetical protein
MRDPLTLTAEKVGNIVQQRGSITLSELESEIDTSYNLIFLAIDRMVSERSIQIKRCGRDYILSENGAGAGSEALLTAGYPPIVSRSLGIGSDLPGEVSLRTEAQYLAQEIE